MIKNRSEAGESVPIRYDDAVRALCLLQAYESAWNASQIEAVVDWWLMIGELLSEAPGWTFCIRDFEPAWVKESGAPMDIRVELDGGHYVYALTEMRTGTHVTTHFSSVEDLRVALTQ